MIRSYVLLGTLGIHSLEDIRDKKITVTVTLCSGIIAILLHLWIPCSSIFDMLAGMASGAAVLLLGRLTKGKIGMGDGVVFMLTGLYLGMAGNLALMCISFVLAGFWAAFTLLFCCRGAKGRIPLVPFLFLGYLCMVTGQVAV